MKSKPVLIAILILFSCFFSYGCKHTVTYDANEATSGSVPAEPVQYKKGATVAVLGNTGALARTDYVFTGWNTAADGSGTTYNQGNNFKMGTEDMTLFARWTQEPTYAVTYDENGASAGSAPVDATAYVQGDTVTVLGNPDLVKTGYVFSGWNTQAGGGGTSYAAGATFAIGASNVILYAAWTAAPTYSVTYDENGAETGSAPADAAAYYAGDTVTVLGNTDNMTIAGFNFVGWNSAANGSGTGYGPGTTFAMDAADALLYAWWVSPWSRLLGGEDGNVAEALGIAVDTNGNSFVAGEASIHFDGQAVIGSTDGAIVKHDANGVKGWVQLLGAPSADTHAKAIALDAASNSYVTGYTSGVAVFDNQTLSGSGEDALVVKYNSSGEKQWTRLLGDAGKYTDAYGIAADKNGSVYITGYTNGGLEFDQAIGTWDIFIGKYDTSGSRQWVHQLGEVSKSAYGNAIAVDASGTCCYVAGETNTLSLDDQAKEGVNDALIIKYNASGARQWTKRLGKALARTYAYGIGVDASGFVYVAGHTDGSLDSVTTPGTNDLFVAKFNSSGGLEWVRQLGASGVTVYTAGIAVDAGGNSYVTGYTNGSIDGQPFAGSKDAFVVKYDADGNKQWTMLKGEGTSTFKTTMGNGIALDAAGNTYMAGKVYGDIDGQSVHGTTDFFITTMMNQ